MSLLPLNLPLDQMQTKWKSQIDPLISSPLSGFQILNNVNLINGVTVVNHLLGRIMMGWFIIDIDAAATIYRSAPFSTTTLTLTSNAACKVNLGVF